MRERDFQRQVVEAAGYLGWTCVHFPAMQMNPSGWPDLICFRDGQTEIMELKTERGRLGPRQVEWIERLQAAGMSVNVFRPADWDQIEALLRRDAV
ncbi:MAG: VRR-NUC domain-containing protein [Thermomicrobiales bacterium]